MTQMTIPLGGYEYQTNTSLLTAGELGIDTSTENLITKDPSSGQIVVLGNPSNSTSVPSLVKTYVEDQMDISALQTLGTNFIFLNGTSFDSMGIGLTEFEETDGRVYGLYGRTDGVAQQVYYSAALNNTQAMQYTTVPYVPPFLNGSNWQAQCVCGQDAEGFVLQLRDTTIGSTATPRYIYVKHNSSLINMSGHTYVDISQAVNSYVSSVTATIGTVPNVIRVGAYFFIGMADWQAGSVWTGGWNDANPTFSNSLIPSTAPTYNPTKFTVTTNGLQGGDITGTQLFPSVMGSNTPGGVTGIWRIYDQSTGAITTPVLYNCPEPVAAGWTTNLAMLLEGEADASGNVFLAIGTSASPGDAQSKSGFDLFVFSISVQFTAGSAGAYTSAQYNIATSSTAGVDLHYVQPNGTPFLISTDPGTGQTKPDETQVSSVSVPATCANKLPIASFFTGQSHWGGRAPVISWYYSGVTGISASGAAGVVRGVSRPAGASTGSREAARANKLATIWPMFNVNHRVDFNTQTGTAMNTSLTQPSGKKVLSYNSHMVGKDLILSAAYNPTFELIWSMSQMPANSNITDTSYSRYGQSVPGFGARVAEYLVNLPNPQTTLDNFCNVWPSGMADPKSPVSVIFPTLASSGPAIGKMNNAQVRLGAWTLSGGVYQPPPVVWTYASNIESQVTALYSSAITAAQANYTGFNTGFFVEVAPIINRDGASISQALVLVTAKSSDNITLCTAYFLTPCSITGSVISLTSTGSLTPVGSTSVLTSNVVGTALGDDTLHGTMNVVYGNASTSDWYIGWSNSTSTLVAGDQLVTSAFIHFNSANAVQAFGADTGSVARAYLSCSVQHQGIAIMPYRDGSTLPEVEIPISRYSTSATTTQDDMFASFNAAIANPRNLISGTITAYNLAEITVMDAINNNFLLQVGSISGRLNHKQFILPSSFIDMTSYAVGHYYLYLTDTASGAQLQVDATQRPESNTSMFFGSFDRTSTGFANQQSVSEVIRFGTARLVAGSEGKPMQGSQIRIGAYSG